MTEVGDTHVHVPSGTTPFSPVVGCSTSGVKVLNNVAHLLAISPAVVSVVVAVIVAILGVDRVLHATDVVTLLATVVGAHSAVISAQSLKRSG